MPFKHGEYKTRLYRIWYGMNRRCSQPYATGYADYGGRGIKFDPVWSDFLVFKDWALSNGYAPHLTLERKDVNGNYEPNNCTWADQTTQSANSRKRKNAKHTYKGVDQLPNGSWRATLQSQNKRLHLGSFPDEASALAFRNNYIVSNNLPHIIQ